MQTMNSVSEKQNYRTFFRVFGLTSAGLLLMILGVNYVADRYYVFHPQTEPFTEYQEPNTRVIKANYLAQNCDRFDAVILGSSRAAAIDTGDFNSVFGTHVYNFGVASGSLPGMLARLEWLDALNCMPELVLLPISIDRLRFTERPNDLLRKEHPAIAGGDAYQREFLLSYLGVDAFFSNLDKLLERLFRRPQPRFAYDPRSGDVDYLWDREVSLSSCPERPVNTDTFSIGRYLDYLKRIETLVLGRGSKMVLLWNPIPIADQLAHLDDAQAILESFDHEGRVIYRLPPSSESLVESGSYHDPGHYKPALTAAVFATKDNAVSFGQLLDELKTLRSQCEEEM
jgi:hypothetical protein